jgi:ATP-dependent helicase/nuclease subunit A
MYEKLVLLGNVKKNEIYLDEFMKYFKQMSDLDYSIDDFITYFKYIDEYNLKITLSSVGSSLDSVKIMNIHKSKGLEFPVIYFSGLGAEFVKEEQKKRLSVSKRYGLVIAESKINPIRFLSNYRDNIDIISERIRLLYVSLTRAREKMIFVLENLKNEKPLDRVNSFAEIIHPLYTQFNNYFYDENAEVEELKKENKKIKYKNFLVKKEEFSKERKEKTKASKDLTIGVNSQLLELGTMLHELLEITDFKNPDYSYIENEFYKSKVKKFIESDLLKDVKKGKVFKEYEYIDNEHHGIIDLMIIYDDHIDIIDYKTKNIDDEEYDNQLRTYRKYISKKFDLPIHLYLYSIVDSVYRKIN